MDFDNINDELRSKINKCTSPEEIALLLKEHEGRELTDQELEGLAGGGWGESGGGDSRNDISEECVPKAFMTGELRGDNLD